MNMESNIPQKNSDGQTYFLYLKYIILICFYTTVIFTHADTNKTGDSKTLTIDLKNLGFKEREQRNSVPPIITLTDSGWSFTALKKRLTNIFENSYYDNFNSMSALIDTLRKTADTVCKKYLQHQHCKDFNTQISEIMDTATEFLDRHILYPPGYKPMSSQAENLTNAISLLESNKANCESDCTHHNIVTMVIRYGTREEYSEMRDRLSHNDKQCIKDITKDLAEKLKDERLPKECLQKENKDHIVCKNMLKDINIVQGRVQDLMEMAYSPEEIKITSAQALCIECESINSEDKETQIIDLLNTLEEQSRCADPKPGKEKKVQSGTGINSTYTVRKEQDGSFSIPLNLSFSAASDYDGPVPKNQVPAHYMKKVQECMKKANTKMLGPNGEKLQFVIQEPTSPGVCSGIPIEIGSKEHRSNLSKYNSEIHCATITHEVLHLVGLCDEYKEKTNGFVVNSNTGEIKQGINKSPIDENYAFKPAFDCRVTLMNNSNIMSHHHLMWKKAFSNTDSSKNLKSLLTPGQFNSILYGKCSKKNNLFNQCSQLAYKSTVKEEGKNCLKKKEECENQNGIGEDKTTIIDELQKRIDQIIKAQNAIKKRQNAIKKRQNAIKKRQNAINTPIEKQKAIKEYLKKNATETFTELQEYTKFLSSIGVKEDYRLFLFPARMEKLTQELIPLQKKLSIVKSWPDSQ